MQGLPKSLPSSPSTMQVIKSHLFDGAEKSTKREVKFQVDGHSGELHWVRLG